LGRPQANNIKLVKVLFRVLLDGISNWGPVCTVQLDLYVLQRHVLFSESAVRVLNTTGRIKKLQLFDII